MTYSQITRLINWSAIAIALGLAVLVSYQLYLRHFIQQTTTLSYQFDDLPGTAEAPVTANIEDIIAKHVFGVVPEIAAPQAPEVVEIEAEPAPKTRLNIKLTGIIDASAADSGMAMLEVDRGRTIVVSVGEKIDKTDAILHQVLPGEILIDRGGTIESVKMVRKTLSIVKLESKLLNSLPQPYVEDQGMNTYQRTPSKPARTQTPARLAKQSDAFKTQASPTRSTGYSEQVQPPPLPRVEREPMKSLPIPRMLQ